jgi:hypothetical protein
MKIIITESSRDRLVLKWLNREFGDLTMVVKGSITYYVDKEGLPLFYYYQDEENEYVYINYNRIWIFFKSIFGLGDSQTRDILSIWLEDTYNLGGTPSFIDWLYNINWKRPII